MTLHVLAVAITLIVVTACAPVTAPQISIPEPKPPGSEEAVAIDQREVPTITCGGTPTSQNQEGPYYTAGSPQRSSLIEEGMQGIPILISGRVLVVDCSPVANATVDVWQADAFGMYDNVGYTLRGHVVTAEDGSYSIETILPGPYTGRPPHIHVKVFAADGHELLTTQMYVPGSEGSGDVRVAPDLLVDLVEPSEDSRGEVNFDFIVGE